MTAATLHQISGGRYLLGLGASTRALAEGFHDTPFKQPVDKLAATVTAVRALLAGEPAHLRHTRRPVRCGSACRPRRRADLGRGPRPSHSAAGGRARRRLVPRLHGPRPPGRARRPAEGPGARRAQPSPSPRPPRRGRRRRGAARDIAASCIAWYVCAMGDVYARSLTEQGYGAEVEAIRAANPPQPPQRARPRRGGGGHEPARRHRHTRSDPRAARTVARRPTSS